MNDAAGKPSGGTARERGSVALFFLMFLIPLLSFGALAIDIAWVATVRNQLQNAADAAALAAADAMMSPSGGALNWSQAAPAAKSKFCRSVSRSARLLCAKSRSA